MYEVRVPTTTILWVVKDREDTCFKSAKPWKACIRHATGLMEWERFATEKEAIDYCAGVKARLTKA